MSILQCKIFNSPYSYKVEEDFNTWCRENKVGPFDFKDVKYTINAGNGEHCIFVLYSTEVESNKTL